MLTSVKFMTKCLFFGGFFFSLYMCLPGRFWHLVPWLYPAAWNERLKTAPELGRTVMGQDYVPPLSWCP